MTVSAQTHGMGAVLDIEEYRAQPAIATIARRDYESLPVSHSLKNYCPTPGDQGKTGTCTAWSTAYHARTILEGIAEKREGTAANDAETFSPSFIYNQIRNSSGCDDGTSLAKALILMRDQGCLKSEILRFDCDFEEWHRFNAIARPFVIQTYLKLHEPFANNKILPVKKAISSNQPVLIAMHITDSFHGTASDGFYRPTEEDRFLELQTLIEAGAMQGHAMTVVGYDDRKGANGAVQIINSWGPGWADNGYCWVEYADFNRFVAHSFSMIGAPAYNETLSGSFILETERGERMHARFDPEREAYRLAKKHPAKTRFRIYLKNDTPVFLYAFGFDQTTKTFDVFPHHQDTSPFVPYHESHIPIPDDEHFIQIDDVQARNDLCVIYSTEELPIAELKARLQARGDRIVEDNLPLRTAVEEELIALSSLPVPADHITWQPQEFSFTAKRASEVCVPIILEFGN